MSFSTEQIEQITQSLREQLGDNITWKYEQRFSVMLSEFAQNKSDTVLSLLRKQFPHEWDKKTVNRIPKSLQNQLEDLAKINKEQRLLAVPATETTPAMVAFWWPWGHGGTYSLRIKLLSNSYQYDPNEEIQRGFFTKLKSIFN